jgi:hypothetical protein
VPGFPGISPPAHPYHQFSGKVQPQAKEAYAGGEDLPNREACLRLVNAWEVEHSEEWLRGRHYLDLEEQREHRRSRERETTAEADVPSIRVPEVAALEETTYQEGWCPDLESTAALCENSHRFW